MQIQSNNILINVDSYKVGMWKQYPQGAEHVYSYVEARGGGDKILWFGLQAFISEYLAKPVTEDDVREAELFWKAHSGAFNTEGWMYIVREHGGRLPVEIKQIPEGTVVPTGTVLATVVNTDPNVPWLTTWLETALLRAAWYGTNVATVSYNIKQLIREYLVKSGTVEDLGFKLHDFGARGASTFEAASIGGAAHLVNFLGSDNAAGNFHAMRFYGADCTTAGFSIPAAEHSTITSWTREHEFDAYENMVEQFGAGIYACVSDSYNIYEAVEMWGKLKDKIVAKGGTLVVRPDSGDPVAVLRKIVPRLEQLFGSTTNDRGYRVLNNVRVIWGDGINQSTIKTILLVMVDMMGYSADNFAFGMGGALLQGHTRDTFKFAMKASAIKVNGEWRDVFKDPVDDPGKSSKRGLVKPYRRADGSWVNLSKEGTGARSMLTTVFHNGYQMGRQTWEDIRSRAAE